MHVREPKCQIQKKMMALYSYSRPILCSYQRRSKEGGIDLHNSLFSYHRPYKHDKWEKLHKCVSMAKFSIYISFYLRQVIVPSCVGWSSANIAYYRLNECLLKV